MPGPRTRKGPRSERTQKLLTALENASYAQVTGGKVIETHVRIENSVLYSNDGHLTIATPIEDDFGANPNSQELIKALKQTGENVVFTVVDATRLHVKSGPFSCYVPCVASEWLPMMPPDPACAKVNNTLIDAMKVCLAATDEKADNPVLRGVWLDGYSVASSDRHSIFQVWHGIHLPQGLIIPQNTVKALHDKGGELTAMGFTYDRSITFYFADGSWIRSTLMEGKYPDYARILDQPSNQNSIPANFFEGLRSIVDFSDSSTIYFGEGKLTTKDMEGKGATYEVPGISPGSIFNGKRLLALEKYAKTADFYTDRGAVFMGDRMRAIVSRRST